MNKKFGLFMLAVHSLAASAGTLIDDGIIASDKLFPSVIKISNYSVNPKTQSEVNLGHCTGTLIAQDIVLTAAHCVNNDPNVIQRVSHTGDSKGESGKKPKGGGIKVKASFYSSQYDQTSKNGAMVGLYIQSKSFEKLSAAEKEDILIKRYILTKLTSSYDIAFLQLERVQTIAKSNLSTLGCKLSLFEGADVTIAGYGLKSVKDAAQNSNTNYVLNYGYNKISKNPLKGLVYTINKALGKQLVNSGDSGGPLFKKGSGVVYGVTSTKGLNEKAINIESTFANLSSSSARTVFKEISLDKKAPKSLIDALKPCL